MQFSFLFPLTNHFCLFTTICITLINIAASNLTFPNSFIEQLHSGENRTVRILGIFPNTRQFNPKTYTCSRHSLKDIQLTQAMIYTINHFVNNNSKLLPGIKVNYKILDSCSSRHAAVTFLTSSLAASETESCQQLGSNNAVVSKHSSSTGHVPTIGVVAEKQKALQQLLHHIQVAYTYRKTTSPLELQVLAIADIVAYFNWNWVSIVIGGLDTFNNLQKILFSPFENHNEKIVFKFLEAAQTQNLTGKTFIGTYSWLKSSGLKNISGDVIEGALGIDIKDQSLQKYVNYLNNLDLCNNPGNPWLIRSWHEMFSLPGQMPISNVFLPPCHLSPNLKRTLFRNFYETNHITEFVMDSVLALAYALHDYIGCNSSYCPPVPLNLMANNRTEFVKAISNVSFESATTDKFRFRPDGSSQLKYQITNLKPFKNANVNTVIKTKIGSWEEKRGLSINYDKIVWNGEKK
ncbi:Metabotropic glutamate receptor 2 [Trichoplax sp. H2]|nr:Metabotropic glutamate receptor 2 [Trichoplax sp. H2]|eukprot:RDD36277.1 Metabotropic glutamate receptor 2 [Trichoplax sp. H2]